MNQDDSTDNMRAECEKILEEARKQDLLLRLVGGMAVHLHSPKASLLPGLKRNYGDLDFVTTSQDAQHLLSLFQSLGFAPNARFNALHGRSRLIFNAPDQSWHIDIFIDEFHMCHRIRLSQQRLMVDAFTLPLAELLLTKLQIIEINEKDVKDVAALLLEHPIGSSDIETINTDRIVAITSRDWGLHTTARKGMHRIAVLLGELDLQVDERGLILHRLEELGHMMDTVSKSAAWKLRALVGERLRWYDEPEDAVRDAIPLKLE